MERTDLDRLLALEAIRQLKARYCRLYDTQQWARLKTLFLGDARVEGFTSVPDGARALDFIDAASLRLAGTTMVHHVHAPEIVLTGPDHARGIWAMNDYVQFPAGGEVGWQGWGFYEEDYARVDGVWRIAFMRIVRTRLDPLPPGHPAPVPGRHAPDPDWL